MSSIQAYPIPDDALLGQYGRPSSSDEAETYTDCYGVEFDRSVALADFVLAFYTTPLFRVERAILKLLVARPSTDEQASALANGTIDRFAAWTVEQRTEDELLMCDFRGRTRSWFMVEPISNAGRPKTLLRFGSAVVPGRNSTTGKSGLGWVFRLLLGFHKLYSRALLGSARRRLEKLPVQDR